MSVTKSGNKTHDDTCNIAEGVRQTSVMNAANQAAAIAAEVTFYKSVAKSCRDNNNYSGVAVAQHALRALGVTGAF
jgi:hypothetical protein